MRFFEFKHLAPTISIPTVDNFIFVSKVVNSLIKENSEILTCALYWGSAVTCTIKITSDLDLIFLYPIKNTERVEKLLKKIKEFANNYNVPVEIMCLPEEFYFGTGELDLGKLLMINEYEKYNPNIYICGKRDCFTLENFGYKIDSLQVSSLLRKSYEDYIRHKYDRMMRVCSDWDNLNEKERCLQAGKFISMPAHAIRKFAQSIGQNAIGFETCIKNEEHPIKMSQIDSRLIDYYSKAEMLKHGYLYELQQYVCGNGSLDSVTDCDYINGSV